MYSDISDVICAVRMQSLLLFSRRSYRVVIKYHLLLGPNRFSMATDSSLRRSYANFTITPRPSCRARHFYANETLSDAKGFHTVTAANVKHHCRHRTTVLWLSRPSPISLEAAFVPFPAYLLTHSSCHAHYFTINSSLESPPLGGWLRSRTRFASRTWDFARKVMVCSSTT